MKAFTEFHLVAVSAAVFLASISSGQTNDFPKVSYVVFCFSTCGTHQLNVNIQS